VLGC